MQTLRMKKEYFRYRGELQNDSISGINSDEKRKALDDINKEQRRLVRLRPPYFGTEFFIRQRASVPLKTSSDVNTVTGTKYLPQLVDSDSNLTLLHKYWAISDGTYRYRVNKVTGTTYELDYATFTTGTTGTLFTAYKDVYAIPHNCGDIINISMPDGIKEIRELSIPLFEQTAKRANAASQPDLYSLDAFTNRTDPYKFSQAAVTFTNGSTEVSVGTTAEFYDTGDNILVTTTYEYNHTIKAVDASANKIWLDRPWNGDTAAFTVYCNPRNVTRYISFYPIPDTDEAIRIHAYLKPDNLVKATDECVFEEDMCWAIIVGALIRDDLSRKFVPQTDIAWYEGFKADLRMPRNARVNTRPPSRSLGGGRTFGVGRVNL